MLRMNELMQGRQSAQDLADSKRQSVLAKMPLLLLTLKSEQKKSYLNENPVSVEIKVLTSTSINLLSFFAYEY